MPYDLINFFAFSLQNNYKSPKAANEVKYDILI